MLFRQKISLMFGSSASSKILTGKRITALTKQRGQRSHNPGGFNQNVRTIRLQLSGHFVADIVGYRQQRGSGWRPEKRYDYASTLRRKDAPGRIGIRHSMIIYPSCRQEQAARRFTEAFIVSLYDEKNGVLPP